MLEMLLNSDIVATEKLSCRTRQAKVMQFSRKFPATRTVIYSLLLTEILIASVV